MVEPKKRTRSVKKVSRRTPKGRVVTHYKSERAAPKRCGRCGKDVSEKSVKAYGSTLCGDCTTDLLRYVVEWKAKFLSEEMKDLELSRDLSVERFLPQGWFANLSRGVYPKRKAPRVFKRTAPKAASKEEEAAAPKKTKPSKKPAAKKAASKKKPASKKPAKKKE